MFISSMFTRLKFSVGLRLMIILTVDYFLELFGLKTNEKKLKNQWENVLIERNQKIITLKKLKTGSLTFF